MPPAEPKQMEAPNVTAITDSTVTLTWQTPYWSFIFSSLLFFFFFSLHQSKSNII